MPQFKDEKRKYPRYHTEVKIQFYVPYDLNTRVQFQLLNPQKMEEHIGTSRNISAGGICILSEKKLEKGNILSMKLFLPNNKQSIPMEGEVRWSQATYPNSEGEVMFESGIQLKRVNGQLVDPTIHFDQEHQVIWSVVLETVLGKFGLLHKKIS